ncbi:MAG: hypothetical protein ACQEUT_18390 [Bacillota bacterium]
MNEYLVFVTMGGLMEDPEFHDEHHLIVAGYNEDEAVNNWAKDKGFTNPAYLKKRGNNWSYWGWRINVRQMGVER